MLWGSVAGDRVADRTQSRGVTEKKGDGESGLLAPGWMALFDNIRIRACYSIAGIICVAVTSSASSKYVESLRYRFPAWASAFL